MINWCLYLDTVCDKLQNGLTEEEKCKKDVHYTQDVGQQRRHFVVLQITWKCSTTTTKQIMPTSEKVGRIYSFGWPFNCAYIAAATNHLAIEKYEFFFKSLLFSLESCECNVIKFILSLYVCWFVLLIFLILFLNTLKYLPSPCISGVLLKQHALFGSHASH